MGRALDRTAAGSHGCTGASLHRWQTDPTPVDEQRAKRATLVLADISGYTGFLAAVGIAHGAQLDFARHPLPIP